MNRLPLLAASAVTSIAIVSSISGTAFAWHPKGVITKSVQNVTTSGVLSAADTSNAAVAAKPGDVLNYVIVVSNTGSADVKGYNDMAKTVLTDTLPAGVELVSNPSQRQITENLGLIKPGDKVTKTYQVKVTAGKDGVIENKACFTGNSTANDNPQAGCDVADVKVTVPVAPVTPVAPTPVVPAAPVSAPVIEQPTVLPNTGAGSVFALFAGISSLATAAHFILKRRVTA